MVNLFGQKYRDSAQTHLCLFWCILKTFASRLTFSWSTQITFLLSSKFWKLPTSGSECYTSCKKKKKQTPEQTYIFGIQFTLLFDWQLWLCSNVPVTGWQTSIFLSYIRYKYFILLHLPTVSSSLNKASCNSCWIASVVPVIRVWLLGSSLWKSTSLSGIEVRKAVLLPVEVWALVQTDIRLRLHLLVPIPIGVVSATDTIQTYLMSDLISNA